MRKPLSRLASIITLSLLAILLLAQPVLAYLYRAPLAIVESSSNAYTMLPVRVAASNTWMAANGFMTSTALDTRVETLGGVDRPWMVADDKTLTATAVPADSQVNLYFVTGEAAATDMNIIVGRTGYVTTTDAAALEPASNSLELEWQGWFDAALTGNILCKTDSYCLDVAVAGTVRGYVGTTTAGSVIIRPNGTGDANAIPSETGCGAGVLHWQCVDEVVADDAVTMVWSLNGGDWSDYYSLDDPPAFPSYAVITSVVATHRSRTALTGTYSCARPVIRLGGVDTIGTSDCSGDYVWRTTSETLARPGGGAWSTADITALQAGVRHQNSDVGDLAETTQVYVTANYNYPTSTILTAAVTDGLRRIKFTKSAGTDLEILTSTCTDEATCTAYVSQDTDNSPVAEIMDISTNILSNHNGPVAYGAFSKITINGVLIVHYEPVTMIIGTALPDREGAAQNGVITWGANPAGVTVTLGSMTSSGTQSIGATATVTPRDILPPVTVSDWFGDGTVSGKALTNPMRSMVTAVSDETTLSEIQVWRLAGIIFWLAVTVWTGRALKHHYGLTAIASGVALGALVAFDHNIFPMWLLVITAGCFAGGIIAERSPVL